MTAKGSFDSSKMPRALETPPPPHRTREGHMDGPPRQVGERALALRHAAHRRRSWSAAAAGILVVRIARRWTGEEEWKS